MIPRYENRIFAIHVVSETDIWERHAKNHGPFSAPELKENNYDFKVDLYCAGMVLYYNSRYLEDKALGLKSLRC